MFGVWVGYKDWCGLGACDIRVGVAELAVATEMLKCLGGVGVEEDLMAW